MRRFDSIVMQETEPEVNSTLWLRKSHNNIEQYGDPIGPVGTSFWWYGENGWEPLSERYLFKNTFHTDPSDTVTYPYAGHDEENGIITIGREWYIYDGERDIQDNYNIVLETGMKRYVDDLQSQINSLKQRVESLEAIVGNHTTLISSHTTSISSLNSRVTSLESSVE